MIAAGDLSNCWTYIVGQVVGRMAVALLLAVSSP